MTDNDKKCEKDTILWVLVNNNLVFSADHPVGYSDAPLQVLAVAWDGREAHQGGDAGQGLGCLHEHGGGCHG